jgi:tetratricopeptide (TPR) repeat protein
LETGISGRKLLQEAEKALSSKEFEKAAGIAKEAINLLDAALGYNSRESVKAAAVISGACTYMNKYSEASSWCIECYNRVSDKKSREAGEVAARVACLVGLVDDPEGCMKWSKIALEVLENDLPDNAALTAHICKIAGISSQRMDDIQEAYEYFNKYLDLMPITQVATDMEAVNILLSVAEMAGGVGQKQRAEHLLGSLKSCYDSSWDRIDKNQVEVYKVIGKLYEKMGDAKSALGVSAKLASKV